MNDIDHIRIPKDLLDRELAYVMASRGCWQRFWRSLCAAWRCARAAQRVI
jgi:hypothetical protein